MNYQRINDWYMREEDESWLMNWRRPALESDVNWSLYHEPHGGTRLQRHRRPSSHAQVDPLSSVWTGGVGVLKRTRYWVERRESDRWRRWKTLQIPSTSKTIRWCNEPPLHLRRSYQIPIAQQSYSLFGILNFIHLMDGDRTYFQGRPRQE